MADENEVMHGHHRGDARFLDAYGQFMAEAVVEVELPPFRFFGNAESAPK